METEFIDIKEDKGVQKKILVQGEGEEVLENCRCKVYLRGYLEDGKEFENNLKDKKPKKLTAESDFKGLNMALKGMKKGEKALIKVSSKYGFGEEGDEEKRIPANATLFYEVEMVSFKAPKKQRWDMSDEEKMQKAQKLRAQGTKKYKENSYKDAKKLYKDGLQYCNSDTQEGKELKASLHLNLSICCFQLYDFKDSIENAKKAIELNTNNEQKIKGYYRVAQAYEKIGELEKAEQELKEALKLEENNTVIIEELHKIKQLNREAKIKEKEAFSKLFNQKLYDDEEINPKKNDIREVKSDDDTSLSDKNEKIEEENDNEKNKKEENTQSKEESKIEQEPERKQQEIEIKELTTA